MTPAEKRAMIVFLAQQGVCASDIARQCETSRGAVLRALKIAGVKASDGRKSSEHAQRLRHLHASGFLSRRRAMKGATA